MKKLLVFTCLAGALALATNAVADDTKKDSEATTKPKLTAEQKSLRKEITAKYDTNKDGKLDKEERASISSEDKAKMEKAGLGPKKKKADKADKATK